MAGLLRPQQKEPMPAQTQVAEEDDMGEDDADESHPAFVAAVEFVKTALYESGASDQVNELVKKSQSPIDDLANMAYELTSIADEKTDGQVPDELLVLLASTVLAEVSEIAEASGVQLQAADVASALKMMILRFVGEQGYDTRELHAAMNQVSPDEINKLAAEEMPEEQEVM